MSGVRTRSPWLNERVLVQLRRMMQAWQESVWTVRPAVWLSFFMWREEWREITWHMILRNKKPVEIPVKERIRLCRCESTQHHKCRKVMTDKVIFHHKLWKNLCGTVWCDCYQNIVGCGSAKVGMQRWVWIKLRNINVTLHVILLVNIWYDHAYFYDRHSSAVWVNLSINVNGFATYRNDSYHFRVVFEQIVEANLSSHFSPS